MKTLFAVLFGAVMVSGAAPVDYATGFSAGDSPAFVDGRLDAQNSWVAHPNYAVSDSAGLGRVNRVNANGPVHLDSSADITSELAAGETITLTLEFNFEGGFVDQNSGAWLLGLSNDAGGMPEGASGTIGCAVFQNLASSTLWLSPIGFPNGEKFDTGIAWDSADHILTTTITRSATTDEFAITVDLDGQLTSYSMTHAGLWSGADTAYAGFRFRGSQSGNIDAFSVSSTGATGGGGGEITIDAASYDEGSGFTILYQSALGPVDVYRNDAGDLVGENYSLIASNETGGVFIDATADAELMPNVFYVLVKSGELPFRMD